MSAPATEPRFWKEVAHTLSKIVVVVTWPLDVISTAVSGRLEILLKRKPVCELSPHVSVLVTLVRRRGEEGDADVVHGGLLA